MHSRQVEIKSPCHESWDAMHGDDSRRFCDVCAKHVHNLSAMERDEATELLRTNKGEHLCVRYASHEDGSIAFRDSLVPMSRLRSVRTAFAAVMLAACSPHDGPPIQDLGEVAIEAMARDAVASPEGGCDVRTGPLTTLHYPAGHEVCKYLPDRGATIVQPTQPGYTPPPPPQPPEPPPPMMGQMAVDPRPKMGEAVPELKEPCDPQPHVDPLPPIPPPTTYLQGDIAPPKEPPPPPVLHEEMGDIAVPDVPPPPPEPRVKMGKMKPVDMKTGGAVVGGDFD
jgi:hypothetical protein